MATKQADMYHIITKNTLELTLDNVAYMLSLELISSSKINLLKRNNVFGFNQMSLDFLTKVVREGNTR